MKVRHPIILVSQDKCFVSHFKTITESRGFTVSHHNSCNSAMFSVQKETPAGILTEKDLKDFNGYYLCRKIREIYTGPIIFLSQNKKTPRDLELLAFETGADDYFSKNTHPDILFARLQAAIRRSSTMHETLKKKVRIGALFLDPTRREAMVDNHPMNFTGRQFDLLWYLAVRKGEVITRNELYEVVYAKEYNGRDRSMDVMISRIRRKLEDRSDGHPYIKTVHGTGYCFVPYA